MNPISSRTALILALGLTVLILLGCTSIGTPPANSPPTVTIPGHTANPPTPAALGHRTKTSGCVIVNALPDAACTPGAIIASATRQQICTPGYSSNVRDVPTAEKDQVYAEYGIKHHSPGQYEVDHLISLELGGSNDISNLWPEAADPRPGFHEKDQVENYLHQQMCSGAIPLRDAQVTIANNWYAVYSGGALGANPPVTVDTTVVAPPTVQATSVPLSSGRYVASSEAQHYYYCVTDDSWKKLKAQLVWSNDPSVFTAKGLALHAPCQ